MSGYLFNLLTAGGRYLTPGQVKEIKERRAAAGAEFIGAALEVVPFATVSALLYDYMQIETIEFAGLRLDTETARMLGRFYSLKYGAIPIQKENGRLWVAMQDPLCGTALAGLADLTDLFIEPLLAREADIHYYINHLFGSEEIHSIASQFISNEKRDNRPEDDALSPLQNAPAVRFIDNLIERGVLNRASDIHIEPCERYLRARYRVDGRLETFELVDISLLSNIISRLKILGGMDIAEKRLPQDGHFSLTVHNENIDFRLSTLPTFFGEKAVLRLLYRTAGLKKEELGFFPEDLVHINRLFRQPYGAVFMTGPTGSGKSTTLNIFMDELNTENVNIVTAEDPVETPIFGINHMKVDPAAGLTFAGSLRNILRQDPDVIMVGEIRDEETARMAVQAAITGHLVLSTLHTNDAAGVIERLAYMGIEPYLTASALNGVISQRLVRRICPNCRSETALSGEEQLLLQIPAGTPAYKGKGCGHCNHTGYKGRFALYEYIVMDERRRRMMSANPSRFAFSMRKKGGLRENALKNLQLGNTTPSEIIRTLNR